MYKAVCLTILSFFFMSFFESMHDKIDDISPKNKAIQTVIKLTADELQKKYSLILVGVGGSSDNEKITLSKLSFNLFRLLSNDEARELILECSQLFLKNINEDKNLTQYLSEVPFTHKNIEITIVIYNSDRSFTYHPNLTVISIVKNILIYSTNDPDRRYRFKSIIEETYEEAIKKLKVTETSKSSKI